MTSIAMSYGRRVPDPNDDMPARGRPARLSRELIVEAAAGFDSVDDITMRELAARLGVRHGALYRWLSTRDELFDLIGEVVVDRILESVSTDPARGWRTRLRRLGTAVHDEFRAVPGYASHLTRPHPHHHRSAERLRQAGTAIFLAAGAAPELADESWDGFLRAIVGWLAVDEQARGQRAGSAVFDRFLDALVRGLPVRQR